MSDRQLSQLVVSMHLTHQLLCLANYVELVKVHETMIALLTIALLTITRDFAERLLQNVPSSLSGPCLLSEGRTTLQQQDSSSKC